ncbi:glycosyltransferase, partial [Cohnella sp. GbtcB17]|uniref:glycosyltransferase n=1 Tax=Cohnella sp. GbtcB17 TaxID=2824762 RepID=UPI0020C71EA9
YGIPPVEAQACGTPATAYGRGGSLETVRGLGVTQPTGVFFEEQTPAQVMAAVSRFENEGGAIQSANCRKNAVRFSPEAFRKKLQQHVDNKLHQNTRQAGSVQAVL